MSLQALCDLCVCVCSDYFRLCYQYLLEEGHLPFPVLHTFRAASFLSPQTRPQVSQGPKALGQILKPVITTL